MKTKNFFSVIFLVLGSVILNVANVFAQTPIRPIDPSYQDGVEKYVGIAVPGDHEPIQLVNVGFTVAEPLDFSNVTYTLAGNIAFSVRREYPYGQTSDSLFLTINFQPRQYTPYGQDLLDTLTISLPGEIPFVLPLRGSSEAVRANRPAISFAEQVLSGDTSSVTESVTITTLGSASAIEFQLDTHAFYAEIVRLQTGVPVSRAFLNVWFTPPSDDSRNTPFTDTLSVTSADDSTHYVLKIPLSAYSKHISVEPNPLNFSPLKAGYTDTLDLEVKVRGRARVNTVLSSDLTHFSPILDSDWHPESGGTVHVVFKPNAVQGYTADLIFSGDNLEPYTVLLKGEGLLRSVITADSTEVHFGTESVGKTVVSGVIRVTLTDPWSSLSTGNFTVSDTVFKVVSVVPVLSPDTESVVNVTLSFTPNENREFESDLVVHTFYANDLRIPLFGTGENKPVLDADSTEVHFGEVEELNSQDSGPIRVTLAHYLNPLSTGNFSIKNPDGIFIVKNVLPVLVPGADTSAVLVTLTFAPISVGEFRDTLIVQADYADDLLIPLYGIGTESRAVQYLSVLQQATAISGTEAVTVPTLSVKEGDIIVSRAPVGSSIQVYNLQGQALKTQTVASDTEILTTASFPQNVYIVVVNDQKQLILKQKVVL